MNSVLPSFIRSRFSSIHNLTSMAVYYTTKQTLIVPIRKKYEKYNDIFEGTIDDINANERLDGIFDDFESKDL